MPTLRHSPFKLLDPYTRADANVFFGREPEVQTLYESVNKNRLVLVYGPSGTGKTSLVQCGLAARFDATDWLPFFIQRGEDINHSLRQALAQNPALANTTVEALPPAIERLGNRYLRPVFLIFDQFEELLISGRPGEQDAFIGDLRGLLQYSGESSCHVLLILREEYLAALYHFEKAIPGLFDRRLRVEPMHGEKLAEVIQRSCRAFNIRLEAETTDTELILNSLGAGKSSVALPYLQVYLDMLYQEDLERDFPNGYAPTQEQPYPPLTFSTEEIKGFGEIGDVLEKFLDNTLEALRPALKAQDWPEETLARVLDVFVTDEGTKRPVYFDRGPGQDLHPREQSIRERLAGLPAAALTFSLEALERYRLLRPTGEGFELAHDSLAAVLDRRRSAEQRRLNEARTSIRNAWQDFQASGEYLSRKKLNVLEPLLPHLGLEPTLADFVRDSSRQANRKEQRERWRNRLIITVLASALGVSLFFFFSARREKENAQESLEKFLSTEAGNVRKEAGARLEHAAQLHTKGYPDVADSMRADVRRLLDNYGQNPKIRVYRDSIFPNQ